MQENSEQDVMPADRHLVVIFPVGAHRLALVAERVREVVAIGRVTALPPATDSLLGAISVRGLLLPLYDLAPWCGDSPISVEGDLPRFAAICEILHSSFAIRATDHPTIVMTTAKLTHGAPVVIDDEICLGVDPQQLFDDLTRSQYISRPGPSGFIPDREPDFQGAVL